MRNKHYRTGSAREDWNLRAREDFYLAIVSGTSGDEAAFQASGERDATELVDFLATDGISDWRVLEYGCGVGRLMVPLLNRFKEIHGIDISDEMVRIGRERNAGRSGLHFHVIEDGKLPLPDKSFDLVYSFAVVQHMPKEDFREILPEIARVLNPGGWFAFQLVRPYTVRRRAQALFGLDQLSWRNSKGSKFPDTRRRRYYTHGQLRRLLKQNGLRWIRSAITPSDHLHEYYLAQRSMDD